MPFLALAVVPLIAGAKLIFTRQAAHSVRARASTTKALDPDAMPTRAPLGIWCALNAPGRYFFFRAMKMPWAILPA